MIFSRIFASLKRIATAITEPLQKLFRKPIVSVEDIGTLRTILVESDVGKMTTEKIITQVTERMRAQGLSGNELSATVRTMLIEGLRFPAPSLTYPSIICLLGVNGSGKTTTAAKLAASLQREGRKVLLVAADTFRAAAQEQLEIWGNRLEIPVLKGTAQQDPATLIFQACTRFRMERFDCMIVDTAGRLHTDPNLMAELAKIQRVMAKQLPETPCHRYIIIDSMLGQNSLVQAREFHRLLKLEGAILTKLDGTGKGGIAIRIVQEEQLPIRYITTGETIDALTRFDPETFVDNILGIS